MSTRLQGLMASTEHMPPSFDVSIPANGHCNEFWVSGCVVPICQGASGPGRCTGTFSLRLC
eukprot:1157800-Pelagomonas_calceolata.AAC.2